jgi:anti-sigma factor RsiW
MQEAINGKLNGADTGLFSAHLDECAACREDYRQSSNLLEMLRGIPVPPPSAGFADRALSNATRLQPARAGSRKYYVTGGIAASLVAVFLMISVMTGPGPDQPSADIVMIDGQVKTIRVAIE